MKLTLILFLLLSTLTYSQVGGGQVFNFLNVTTSARQAALGGEVLTLYTPQAMLISWRMLIMVLYLLHT
jgi:hypothetical protein